MSQRKISECISVRINVGNYQHIELTKYAEESIEYSSEQDRIDKEDQLTNDLIVSLKRGMKSIPEKLGKGIDQAITVEESICKAIPEWLENSVVPNISNGAGKKYVQITAEQKQQKDEAKSNLSEVLVSDAKPTEKTEKTDDLFEEDEVEEKEIEKNKDRVDTGEEVPECKEKEQNDNVTTEEKVEESKLDKSSSGELDDFFDDDDDDLFGDN